ncbi:MAG: FecR domain-containing protein [Dysgonamonadaceae bacterium]|jgi:ferric-dicitrate binding protein FerR (iron transport regulator)|nr:FecR domain-containing protein [Dysgonamonadaceae bacterium]
MKQLNKQALSPEEKEDILQQVYGMVERHNRKKQRLRYLVFSAAAAACIATLLLFFSPSLFNLNRHAAIDDFTSTSPDNSESPNEIQLLLGNNKTITIENEASLVYNAQGEIVIDASGGQLKAANQPSGVTEMNTLIVPKGKRLNLTLADGSKVWVNAGTTLRFPNVFASDKREIRVDGEIFIEVTRNEAQPFFVQTSRMKIEVLGTRFNVTAYREDAEQSVVLVEGSVNVEVQNRNLRLSPAQRLSASDENISTQTVDVYDYISWKDGVLQFAGEPLSAILLRLSRYYDVSIVCDDPHVNVQKCHGKLVLFDDIENVLQTIYNTIPIDYEMQEDKIVISKR